jgi:hypothetical protein
VRDLFSRPKERAERAARLKKDTSAEYDDVTLISFLNPINRAAPAATSSASVAAKPSTSTSTSTPEDSSIARIAFRMPDGSLVKVSLLQPVCYDSHTQG